MRHITLAIALMIGAGAAAGHASAQSAPPAKVCRNLMGKVTPCPPPKPVAAAKPPPFKPMAAPSPAAAKPGLMSHMATFGHPAAATPPAPAPMAKPPVQMAAHSPPPSVASTGGSQTSRIGATAKCKDGTYWRSQSHSGACSRHNGVAVFY